jgi:hypothetical protein
LKPPIQEFFKKIGADILKIKFDKMFFFKSDFWKLVKFLPRIEELEMKDAFLPNDDEEIGDCELKHLTKLEISGSTDLEAFATIVPSSLKIFKFVSKNEDYWNAEVLGKQKQLEELSLIGCDIKDFKYDSENCHIEKLEIRFLELSNGSAFEKFSEFMKIQESVTELELLFSGQQLKDHDYAGVLTHLLGLKTLKKVTIDYRQAEITSILLRLKVCNPSVDTLIIKKPPSDTNLKSISKFFPNVTDLKVTWKDHENDFINWNFFEIFEMDLQPINSMKQIRKFEIDYVSEVMISRIELNQLQEFRVSRCTNFVGFVRNITHLEFVNLNWKAFIDQNSQLEYLRMPMCFIGVEQLQIALENLPSLKSLEVRLSGCNFGFATDFAKLSDEEFKEQYKKEQAERAAQLIGENYDRLEHLKLDLCWDTSELETIMSNYLKKRYPGVKLWK